SHSHARREIGVLAVRLFEAPPPRLAGDVDDRCEYLTDAASAGFCSSRGKHTLHQIGVPRTCERDRLRKTRRAGRFETMQRFLVEQHGNAEPRAVADPYLEGVEDIIFAACNVTCRLPSHQAVRD